MHHCRKVLDGHLMLSAWRRSGIALSIDFRGSRFEIGLRKWLQPYFGIWRKCPTNGHYSTVAYPGW